VTRARLLLNLRSRRMADSIAKSLEPELIHPAGAKAKARARMKINRNSLELVFQARDTTALRAIMNSYLRMIGACIRVTETISKLDEFRQNTADSE
jgi:tRNA threonylcarbamoyladenosine modification (KEOPS) complex  Pcc1 subunit